MSYADVTYYYSLVGAGLVVANMKKNVNVRFLAMIFNYANKYLDGNNAYIRIRIIKED